ncbi:MAG: single-stranded-DNA-specific exonuclease RecJ [Acidobacteriota bacterium]
MSTGDAVRGQPVQDHWVIARQKSEASVDLAQALGVPEPIARLLICRGVVTPQAAQSFLRPEPAQLHDPYKMLGMREAVARLQTALEHKEPVLIYGDYDVDGTVATVLLKTALERAATWLGVKADVRYHIPHRVREGYGMQDARIEAAAAEGVRLVVSVDTGIRAFAAAAEARRLGLDLIVTDHHLPEGPGAEATVPEAIAVLNPNQPGCPYPCKELCGAAVALKLAQGLLEHSAADATDLARVREKMLPSFLKLAAIATIADAVPLTEENRTLAALGLLGLRQPLQPGLRALMELAQIDTRRPISATDVAFRLAPRINAAGRMDIASDVVEMFLTRDAATARALAEKLHRLNDERRAAEAEALRRIETQIETQIEASTAAHPEPGVKPPSLPAATPPCFILDDASLSAAPESSPSGQARAASGAWRRGVIGILASRVVERTARPALVITHEDGEAYGSGRSVAGFHLLNALTAVNGQGEERLFTRFGGHAHAVGFSLPSERVGELRKRMLRYAAQWLNVADLGQELRCDAEVRLQELTAPFFDSLEQMAPFGHGNEEPVLLSRGVRLAADPRVINDRHLRLAFEDAHGGARFAGVAWSRQVDWRALALNRGWRRGDLLDIVFRLRRNFHPIYGGWELEILGIRPSGEVR